MDRPRPGDRDAAEQGHRVSGRQRGHWRSDARPGAPRLTDQTWLGRFISSASVDVRAATVAGKPDVLPADLLARHGAARARIGRRQRAVCRCDRCNSRRRRTAPATPPAPAAPRRRASAFPASRPGMSPADRRAACRSTASLTSFPAATCRPQFQGWQQPDPNTQSNPIAVIDSGVNVVVEGVSVKGIGDLGTIDISADRLVIWTSSTEKPDLSGQTSQDERMPLEFYAEGNVVFRQGERIIYADRLYYDVPNRVGTVLNADVLTPVRNYAGLLRLHADVVQQTAAGPLLRPKRLPHFQPDGLSGLSASGRRHLFPRHPTAHDRSAHRPAGDQSGDGPAGDRSSAACHGVEQFPVHRVRCRSSTGP